MSDPIVRQTNRTVRVPLGTLLYEVVFEIIDAGFLPSRDLFLLTITDALDPKQDVLARVATPIDIRQADPTAPMYVRVDATDLRTIAGDPFARIASIDDLTLIPRDRTEAVRTGRSEYLSSVFTQRYSALSTADAAYREIRQRLSELVTNWRTSLAAFATTPYIDYTLPVPPDSEEARRIAAFETARTARVAATAVRDTALAARDARATACATSRALYNERLADVAFLDTAARFVSTLAAGPARDFVLQQGAYSSDPTSYAVLLASKRAGLAVSLRELESCAALDRAAETALQQAQADLDTAQRAENVALGAVREVCPTYTP